MISNDDLVDDVERRAPSYLGGGQRDPEVLGALRRVDRRLFLPAAAAAEADADRALPIGRGQTCSEPSMVAFMLDLLEIEADQTLLEIGSGSGYAAAAAALLAGPRGRVIACEALPSLAAAMRANLERWRDGLRERAEAGRRAADWAAPIEIVVADGSLGFPARAPFDRILLSAGVNRSARGTGRAGREPAGRGFSERPLLAQLADGGILLYPETLGELLRVRKRGAALERDAWTGVAFVPLRGKNA